MKLHFIAIGGSAMHNLALALHDKGYEISGSDDVIFEPSRTRLEKEGLLPAETGWFPDRITSGLDGVILGMHARIDNPELLRAQELGLPIYSYPEFLYKQAENKTRVVIAGSHGKTTITSMILHVLHYCGKEVDYMVGAQLDGFDRMVHLTETNDFILLEGDEYLSSPLDRRSKFLWYKPNIALLSGISWDHMNVFPTYEDYLAPFREFLDGIQPGGSITYNSEDAEVVRLVEASPNPIRKLPYETMDYEISAGTTYLETEEGPLPLSIFGKHNLNNLAGAKWICQHMGIDELDFYEAIGSFKGASKRMEVLHQDRERVVIKDFAHAPSKVAATTSAVKEQFPDFELIACLELHTYSSLNAEFIKQYSGSLSEADRAIVYYSPEAVAVKKLEEISPETIRSAFDHPGIEVCTSPEEFASMLFSLSLEKTALLLMSSGNYGGLDWDRLPDLWQTKTN